MFFLFFCYLQCFPNILIFSLFFLMFSKQCSLLCQRFCWVVLSWFENCSLVTRFTVFYLRAFLQLEQYPHVSVYFICDLHMFWFIVVVANKLLNKNIHFPDHPFWRQRMHHGSWMAMVKCPMRSIPMPWLVHNMAGWLMLMLLRPLAGFYGIRLFFFDERECHMG